MKTLTQDAIADMIRGTNGQFFRITFKKRSTGEIRTMCCRLGVKKHLAGGEKRFSDSEKNLITVFEMDKEGYRSIPIDGIICATIDKEDVLAKI